jgi:dual-specificity kinase
VSTVGFFTIVLGTQADAPRQKKPEFFRGNKVDYPNPSVSKSSRRFVKGLKSLKDIIAPNSQHNKLL